MSIFLQNSKLDKCKSLATLYIILLCSCILRNISKPNVCNKITNALKVPMPTLSIVNEESNKTSIYGQNSDNYWMEYYSYVNYICEEKMCMNAICHVSRI